MTELVTKIRTWGNSFGIIVPNEVIKREGFSKGDDVKVILIKKGNVLRETFGAHKFSKPISKIMKEMDKELYDI